VASSRKYDKKPSDSAKVGDSVDHISVSSTQLYGVNLYFLLVSPYGPKHLQQSTCHKLFPELHILTPSIRQA
jgi:hypothetical protein